MEARLVTQDEMFQTIDALRYAAETETDEKKAVAAWAAVETADAALGVLQQENADDDRLVKEYDTNIRQMNNSLRITKAGLVAERSNAELMVAIKSNMNIDEDLKDLASNARKL
jgi:hypothetical protein